MKTPMRMREKKNERKMKKSGRIEKKKNLALMCLLVGDVEHILGILE